jgi:hypothetical protein
MAGYDSNASRHLATSFLRRCHPQKHPRRARGKRRKSVVPVKPRRCVIVGITYQRKHAARGESSSRAGGCIAVRIKWSRQFCGKFFAKSWRRPFIPASERHEFAAKRPLLPQANSRGARCLQFAARDTCRVNVRATQRARSLFNCFSLLRFRNGSRRPVANAMRVDRR